jgi:signal peptidase II
VTAPDIVSPDDEEIVEDDEAEAGDIRSGAPVKAWHGPSRRRWLLFALVAITVIVADQVTKAWVVDHIDPGTGFQVLGTWLAFVYGQNSGMLFGMVPRSAGAFAIISMGVVVLVVVYHAKAGRGIVMTLATSLLLGGAIGNLLDRLRFGSVIDWIDMGIGSTRFWTYNLGDAAITTAILLIIATAIFPVVAEWGPDA